MHSLRCFCAGDNAASRDVCFCAVYTRIKFLSGIRLGFFLSRLFIQMVSKPAFVGYRKVIAHKHLPYTL